MKKKSLITLMAATLFSLSPRTADAVPAYPKPITFTQPDGTVVTICLKGDERLNWAETTDGYTLLQDKDGYWTIAELNRIGNLAPSSLRYNGSTAIAKERGITPKLRYSEKQIKNRLKKSLAKSQQADLMIDGTFPSTGKHKLLCLLVNYSDTKPTFTKEQFSEQMNQKGWGGIGSFRDYYLEQSYGKLDIDVTVTDWITLPKSKGTYGADGAAYMINDALTQLSSTIDLSQFDNDGDGILDGLAVIHQGTGREASGDLNDIWSHSSIIYGQKFNGISVRRYTIEPEIQAKNNKMSAIGVICHEFGHALGAPDFYDTDYSESGGDFCGTGVWDLLGSGAWGGEYGSRPTGINAWQKWVWGWTEPVLLDESTTVTDMPSADQQPVAYRMETGNPGEYYIMENRQQTTSQFDQVLPGHGLIIYHVNENIIREKLTSNDINATYPQGIYTVCADAGVEPDSQASSYGGVNGSGCPYPGEYGYTEFSDETTPSAKSIDGRYSYRALRNITDVNGKVSFEFVHNAEPVKPADLTANASNGQVLLAWTMPQSVLADIAHYNIYRNNVKIAETTGLSYTDANPDGNGVLTYLVDAAYKDGLLSHPVQTSIMVPSNKVETLEATATGNDVSLNWTTSNALSRADLYGGNIVSSDIYADEVELANCYTPNDLSTFVGGKITKMTVFPMQGPSVLSMKLHVWEGDADGSNMTLVSERSVKEFALYQSRELKLTTPVTIKAGKTYWLAVNFTTNNGVVSPAFDKSVLVKKRGCLILKDGEFVDYADAVGNFFVSGALTMPADDTEDEFDTATSPEFDADADLYYPLAFSVYCDGELVGRTTARHKTFTNLADGFHTFAVASYYNGANESVGLSQTVAVGDVSAVSAVNTADGAVRTGKGMIAFNGVSGTAIVSTVDGISRRIALDGGSSSVMLAPGVYIVNIGKSVMKVVVE